MPDTPSVFLSSTWRRVRLGDVCEIISGSTPNSGNTSYWNGDIIWVTPTDLGQLKGKEITTSARRITQAGYDSCSTKIVSPGTVVMSSRAPIGHLGIAMVPLCTNQGCKSFVPGPDVDSGFLYYALRNAVPTLQNLGSGATFAEVSKSALFGFQIPLPPLPEQKRIAALLDEQMAEVERARKALDAQMKTVTAIPAALLREAFAGNL